MQSKVGAAFAILAVHFVATSAYSQVVFVQPGMGSHSGLHRSTARRGDTSGDESVLRSVPFAGC